VLGFIFLVFGSELRPYPLTLSTRHFFMVGYFEIRSPELFAWTRFEMWSSVLSPDYVSLQP
jgi:hypothetical protein